MTYSQSTGRLRDAAGLLIWTGYSGNGAAMNDPAFQDSHMHGPIPQGIWHIGTPTTEKGPLTFPLTPHATTTTFGRSGFLIHGDNPSLNHTASEGCIILPHAARMWVEGMVASGEDRTLLVTA